MEVSNLLSGDGGRLDGVGEHKQHNSRTHPGRHSLTSQGITLPPNTYGTSMASPTKPASSMHDAHAPRPSPGAKQQKHITFELLMHDAQNRARLPMRVMISPHDTTDSILTTVRNFYGLYEGPGVSFEDKDGNILIATFENFEHNMTVYVRTYAPDPAVTAAANAAAAAAASAAVASVRSRSTTTSPRKPKLGAPFEVRPPTQGSRPGSRTAAVASASAAAATRSLSPQSIKSHRSASTAPGAKSRIRATASARPKDTNPDPYADSYSDSDGGNGSVTSSRREAHVSAEISVDNIVEGGRRKRAKFDSSELPLFVPPQLPATNSISSVSPQRRVHPDIAASPFTWSNQRTFAYQSQHQPLPSPLSFGRPDQHCLPNYTAYTQAQLHQPQQQQQQQQHPHQQAHQLRTRAPLVYGPPRQSTGGILPTPEPTVGSVISDEDVALQLMRLGDASNFSHGRTSTSTMDDALSGKAEAASSDESDADEEEDLPFVKQPSSHSHTAGPRRKKQRTLGTAQPSTDSLQSSGDEYEDASFKGESDDMAVDYDMNKARALVPGLHKNRPSAPSTNGHVKPTKSRVPGPIKSKAKPTSNPKVPMSPASLPSQSRKTSAASTINFQAQYGADEEDLSSKPRCQRCRKSKKGCDRQRPCGRCKDAGIGIEGCVSEDEGNGRKGRYGRHMGVPVKKTGDEDVSPISNSSTGYFLTPAHPSDKSKKRKR